MLIEYWRIVGACDDGRLRRRGIDLQQLAIHFPSGENLTAAIALLCPLNIR